MNFKTTYVLFGVLLGMVALFGLVLWFNPAKPTDQNFILPTVHDAKDPIKADDITTVVIERTKPKAEKIVFTRDSKEDKGWRMTEPFPLAADRVNRAEVNRLIDQLLDGKKDEKADLTGALGQWGLDNPQAVLTIKKGDEKEWKVNLGDKVETKGGQSSVVYVTTSDRPKEAMSVKLNQMDMGFKPVNEFRSRSLLADSAFDIQSVTAKDSKHDPVILKKISDNRWRIAQPNYGEADYEGEPVGTAPGAKPTTGVRSLLDLIAAMKIDYKSDKENDFVSEDGKNLEQYGLAPNQAADQLRIEVERTMGGLGADKKEKHTDTLVIGKKVDDKSDKYYAMLDSDKYVVKVAANLEPLRHLIEDPGSLRDRELVHLDAFRIDAVSVKNGSGTLELFKPQDALQWKLYRDNQGQKADDATVRALLDAIAAKRQVKGFADLKADDKSLGLDQPAAVVSLWTDGIQKEDKKDEKKDDKKDEKKEGDKKDEKKDSDKKDEKKDEKKEEKKDEKPKLKNSFPTVELAFGKHDRDKGIVYVRRKTAEDTTPVVVEVPDAILDKVTLGPLAYLDRSLPSFTDDPTKLTLTRDGQTWQLEKDKTVWKITEPKELAGRNANQAMVERIIGELKNLRADKLVSEKSTPEQEKQYKLDKPSTKATVTTDKDKKTTEHVYLFGDEVKDSKGVVTGAYAKQADHDLLFVVGKPALEVLKSDLRDPVVLNFDPNKVKSMKLVGWSSLLGSPSTLDLERKSNTEWSLAKGSSAMFPVDAVKAENLLHALNGLKADFLDKNGPKPEKMDLKDDALEITLTVEGEKDPLTLTVGGETADKTKYFASSNRLPGDAFTVLKFPFAEARTKPTYFRKEEAPK
jgi:hypothetical protein